MESETGNVQPVRMLPPPPRTFRNREDLIAYVKDFAVNHGYVVIIKKSHRESAVILGCDRGGTTRRRSTGGELKRPRKAPSRLINCPFEAVGKKDVDDGVWELRIKNGEHNHEPLKDMSEHPYSRRFNEEEVMQVKEMIEAGVKPREVLETLKKSNPELNTTPKHLYNLKAKISQGKFSETSYKCWKPTTAASRYRTSPLRVSNFIGGSFVESDGNLCADVINPATQEVVSQVPSSTHEEFKSAVFAAKQAFPSWRNTPRSARQHIIIKLLELVRRDIDKLALVISTEQGETIKRTHAGILHSVEVVERGCRNMALQMGEFVPDTSTGVQMHSIREPLGVCAGICHFNYPAVVPLWMFPISIICGNTFILKPSQKSPGASVKLVELAMEAGLPNGVLNIVHGGNETVDLICGDDDIKAISFVGSYTTAMQIYAQAAAGGKRVEANIRSRNLAVVMPDACMDTTLDALVGAGFDAAGHPCMSLSSVIFVGCSAPWEEELVKRARELKAYEGTGESADIGPVISEEAKARICRSVQSAVEGGARLILDGRNIMVPGYEKGNFVGPTLLTGITPNVECFEEDVLGPLVMCTQVNSLNEAIAIVNRQRIRNGASIFTTSGNAAKKFQNEVEAGLVGVNVPVSIPLPFCSSGLTTSFVGNLDFYGKAGVQFYTKVKLVAQQWKGLTSQRISSARTLRVDRDMASDSSSHEDYLSTSETSDREMTDQERPLHMPPNDDPSSIRSTGSTSLLTVRNLTTDEPESVALRQAPDINLSLPETYNWPETQLSTSQSTNKVLQYPERNRVALIAQTNEDIQGQMKNNTLTPTSSYMPPQTPQDGTSNSTYRRTDIDVHTDHGNLYNCIPTPGLALRMNDAIPLSTMEGVNMTSSSHRNEHVEPLPQRPDTAMHLSSEQPSMSESRGLEGIPLHFSDGRDYMPSLPQGQWDNNVIPSLIGNGSFGHGTSETAYMMAPQRLESMLQSLGPDTVTPSAAETSKRLE